MQYPIQVNYQYTNNCYKAKLWLDNLPELFAADFEVASKWTVKEKEKIKNTINTHKLSFKREKTLLQQLNADGLSHPSLTSITHLSVAKSNKDSYVIVCDNERIRSLILNFLITTDKKQLWHNSIFDFKHIYYHTKTLPKSYEDTQLLSKSLLNDANSFKDRTGLKELMGYAYGDWAIAKDNFALETMWDTKTIRYSAIDSCATYKLYEDIKEDLTEWKI